jgi:DNA-binding response OmpR family regulator
MIVEDDPDILNLLSGAFKLKNMEVFKAPTAEACLEVLNSEFGKIDCILIEGNIAQDRGAMLITNARRINPKISILVIADNDSEKTRVLDYGADEFALKPMSTENVADKVFNLIASGSRKTETR